MKILPKLKRAWAKCQAMYCRYFGRNYNCGCGHTAKWKTILTIHGQKRIFKAPSKTPEYCPLCWAEAAIKCAWCDRTIIPGDAITLYSPGKPTELFISTQESSAAQEKRKQIDFVIPEQAVVYRREPRLVLVGCFGWGCADTGADRAGFWVMPGKVQRVMSPLEELIARGGNEPMYFNDLTNPGKAIPIPDEVADA